MGVPFPYIYAFDADNLTDGNNYDYLQIGIQPDSSFSVRRISGLQTLASKIQIRDANQRQLFQSMAAMQYDWPMVPELVYPKDSQITFDVQTVLKSSNAYATGGSTPNYWSQLIFQGVRVFDQLGVLQTQYRYYDAPGGYQLECALTETGRLAPVYTAPNAPLRFRQPIPDYDFVLNRISLTIATADEPTVVPAAGKVKLMLYDPNSRQMMNVPITDIFLNSSVTGYNSVFPVPPVLYPAGSEIVVDVTSLLIEAEVPATLYIHFNGVWRRPL